MITRQDLREAIAECEGERNPNASTCIKLAAFYTIEQHLFGDAPVAYSFAPEPERSVTLDSGSEFAAVASKLDVGELLLIMDELMSTLSVVNPRLYAGALRKLKEAAG